MREMLLAATAIAMVGCGAETGEADNSADIAVAPENIPTTAEAMALAEDGGWIEPDPEHTLYIDTQYGRVVVLLTRDLAPQHVAQVKTLAREGYYDGLHFYRVIHGFVAQGGDESGERPKGSALETLTAEFEEPFRDEMPWTEHVATDGYADQSGFVGGMPAGRDMDDGSVWLAHCTGAFAFGRENDRDTASTEFYITLQPQRYLDRNLTVFGRVLFGMDTVQAFPRGALGNGGVIENKDDWTTIESVRVAADVPETERTSLEYLDTSSSAFEALMQARRNRSEAFFHFQHGHVDLCQMPLPVRLKELSGQ